MDVDAAAGPDPLAALVDALIDVEVILRRLPKEVPATGDVSLRLDTAVSGARRALYEIRQAARLLGGGAPMVETFPDGKPAWGPLTPRQVIFLAGLAKKPREPKSPGPVS